MRLLAKPLLFSSSKSQKQFVYVAVVASGENVVVASKFKSRLLTHGSWSMVSKHIFLGSKMGEKLQVTMQFLFDKDRFF